MKNLSIILFFLTVFIGNLYAQDIKPGHHYKINFDDGKELDRLNIDVISNPDNIWQLGSPKKNNFRPYSEPNVLITDSINPYPVNDTSMFTITCIDNGIFEERRPIWYKFEGRYFVNSDSLNDFGRIEFSPNNGRLWVDITDSTLISTTKEKYWTWYTKPVLTGDSKGWKYFWGNFKPLGKFYNVKKGDTLIYRFSFISDGINTNKGGLIFDDLESEVIVHPGIIDGKAIIESKCFPNPVRTQLVISLNNNNSKRWLYSKLDMK